MARLAILGMIIVAVLTSFAHASLAESYQGKASPWVAECKANRMTDTTDCELVLRLDRDSGYNIGSFSVSISKNKSGQYEGYVVGAPYVAAAVMRVDKNKKIECHQYMMCPIGVQQTGQLIKQLKSGDVFLINILTVKGEFTFDAEAGSFREALGKIGWK